MEVHEAHHVAHDDPNALDSCREAQAFEKQLSCLSKMKNRCGEKAPGVPGLSKGGKARCEKEVDKDRGHWRQNRDRMKRCCDEGKTISQCTRNQL